MGSETKDGDTVVGAKVKHETQTLKLHCVDCGATPRLPRLGGLVATVAAIVDVEEAYGLDHLLCWAIR
ncbi:hypothetical protein ACLKA6_014112 [Drosophila palustris]